VRTTLSSSLLCPLSQKREYDLSKFEDLKAEVEELEKRLEALAKRGDKQKVGYRLKQL
jgi:uncharacterized membrane protein (DUF106 family)